MRRPYSILLPVGFTMPPLLPDARCALTAPFHCRVAEALGRSLRDLLSVALSLGSPPPGVTRHRSSLEPGLSSRAPFRKRTGGRPALWRGKPPSMMLRLSTISPLWPNATRN